MSKLSLYLVISLIVIVFILNGETYAAEFSISSVEQKSLNVYRGDLAQFVGAVTAASDNYCKITCQYNIGSDSGYVSDSGNSPATEIDNADKQNFPFKIRAEGTSGLVTQQLTVSCDRVPNYINCWPGSSTKTQEVSLSFLYAGDGKCTDTKEKCASYQSFIGTSDCACTSTEECRPDGERNPDKKGCESFCGNGIYESEYENCTCSSDFTCPTGKMCEPNNGRPLDSDGCSEYCGNGKCEKEYENCSSCPNDCGKCDIMPCTKNSECTNGYCVWGLCWNNIFRMNDGHCDSDKRENCANSPIDCACSENQRCNSRGFCETYCGNSICETGEEGVCKEDCKWCGDGRCEAPKNCVTCPSDCGMCRNVLSPIFPSYDNSETTTETETETPIENKNDINSSPENINESLKLTQIETNKTEVSKPAIVKNIFNLSSIIALIVIIGIIFLLIIFVIRSIINNKTRLKLIKCYYCKKLIDEDSVFCIYCGEKI